MWALSEIMLFLAFDLLNCHYLLFKDKTILAKKIIPLVILIFS